MTHNVLNVLVMRHSNCMWCKNG